MCENDRVATSKRTVQMNTFVYVDTVVFTVNPDPKVRSADRLEVLIMRRPGAKTGMWALPGGLVADRENLPDTAIRKVHEETGLHLATADIHQVGAFGDPVRDSRWRAISIAYMALLPHPGVLDPHEHSDGARFERYRTLRDRGNFLEFDHREIIKSAREVALRLLEDSNAALSFCRPRFTMTELRNVYEAFLQADVDPANFRRKVDATEGFVVPLDEYTDSSGLPGRPAQLFRAGRARTLNPPIRFRRDPASGALRSRTPGR